MAHPVTATATAQPNPIDLDPPPSYDYVVKLDQYKNQPVPVQPLQNTHSTTHHHHHPHNQGVQSDLNQSRRNQNINARDYQYETVCLQNEDYRSRDHNHDQETSEVKSLVWLYGIAFYDMIASVLFIVSVSLIMSDKRIQSKDRDKLIPGYTMVLLFLIIQFLMGAILIAGLRTPNDSSKIACLQAWLYGAYLLIFKDLFLLFGIVFKFSSVSNSGKGANGVLVNVINIMVRTLCAIAIKKHVELLRARLAFRSGLVEITRDQIVVRDMRQHYSNPGRVWHIPMRANPGESVQFRMYEQPPPPYHPNMMPPA